MEPTESKDELKLTVERVGKLRFLKAEDDGLSVQIRIPLHFEQFEDADELEFHLRPYCIELKNKLTSLKLKRNATN